MQSKAENTNGLDPDPHVIQPYTVHSEPWWGNMGYSAIPQAMTGGNASHLTSPEDPDDSESNDGQSLSSGRLNEEDADAAKESQATASSQSGNRGQHQNVERVASSMNTMHDGLSQSPQFELVSHSIACASNPYQDAYYGGMMAYGHQPLGYPQFAGMPHARMLLPLEVAQEPVYVNAKQYQGILRRREQRAKAEAEKKTTKIRKPYLHESRHRHAMRRERSIGGRFAKRIDTSASTQTAKGKVNGSGSVRPSQSCSSSGSEPMPSDSVETWNSTDGQREAYKSVIRGGDYQNHNGLHSAYSSFTGEKEEGDNSGQRPGSVSSNHAKQRSYATQ